MNQRPLLSVIIPSYNRPQHMAALLESILAQDFDDWECVVAEDCAPRRDEVTSVVTPYLARSGGRLRYHLNVKNLGYDGSFRQLVELARGRFVFVMGDDDEVAPGAFRAVDGAVRRHPQLGVLRGTIGLFRTRPGDLPQVRRYYAEEKVFPAGPQAIVATYRRLVAMSGLVLHRDLAKNCATSRWDGTLFYQHWLGANIMTEKESVFLPEVLAYFREGGVPLFGTAGAEQGLYTPGSQPPDTDLRMLSSLLQIAEAVEVERGVPVADAIRRDFGTYIYPSVRHQAHEPWPVFYRYYQDLGKLGFKWNPMFHFWFWSVALLGAPRIDRLILFVRRRLGHTPNLSRVARR